MTLMENTQIGKRSVHTTIFVSVKSADQSYFEEEARAVTSSNEKGVFDILPEHENFISIITQKIIIYKTDGTKQEIPIDTGILKVHDNKVYIFLGIVKNEEKEPVLQTTSV